MKQGVKILIENILKESVEDKPEKAKIKLVPLWQDRKEQRLKQKLKALQKEVIEGDLYLTESPIENLGNVRHVKGDLLLICCTNLTSLPEGLTVDGGLDLDGCINLKELPKGLIVKEWLDIDNCTSLTSLPTDLQVGYKIFLEGCQQSVIDQAKQIFPDKNLIGLFFKQ